MTTEVRVERDSMGALDVPADALWGAQTQRAIQNFPPSGLEMLRTFIHALGLIKRLLDPIALTECGIKGAGSTGR